MPLWVAVLGAVVIFFPAGVWFRRYDDKRVARKLEARRSGTTPR